MINEYKQRTLSLALSASAIALYLAIMMLIGAVTKSAIAALTCANLGAAVSIVLWRQKHKADPLIAQQHVRPMDRIIMVLIVIMTALGSTSAALWVKQLSGNPSPLQDLMSTTPLALIIAASLTVAPIGEEALIRGLVYPLARQHLTAPVTIMVTTCLFALLHSNLVQAVLTLPLGIVLGYVYERTHDLRLCIGLHMLFNLMTVVLPSRTMITAADHIMAGVMVVLMIGTLSLWMTTGAKHQG